MWCSTDDAARNSLYTLRREDRMIVKNELETNREEATVTLFKVLSLYLPSGVKVKVKVK